jgi:outer membrane receptor protein involved in Fe transport
MKTRTGIYAPSLIAIGLALSLPVIADETPNKEIETIVVKGELLPTTAQNATNSIDVINKEALEKTGADHIQDVLQQVGNINYASGSSRARFFQIRGIGERSQFVDPVNPSVGVAIDRIDYSEMANAATLFDIDQVEIFKGPQGTNAGANAMAGFINLLSTETGSGQENKLRISAGNYGFSQLAVAYGGDITSNAEYRVSVNKVDGDGYIENTYLNRKDTNGFDELSVRAMLDVDVTQDWTIKAVLHKFDIDNGYDAFSLDLNRTTLSDEPGFDKQDTTSIAITNTYSGLQLADLEVFVSHSSSDLDYGYDEDWAYGSYNDDWSFTGIHPDGYSSTDYYFRERDATQLDLRLSGKEKDWVVGFYQQQKDTDLIRLYTWNDADFNSDYNVANIAIYGEKRFALSDSITIATGLRVENYKGDYTDSNGTISSTDDTMWGGHFTASKQYNESFLAYFRLSKGFKAGGVNGEALSKLNDESLVRFYGELIEHANFKPESLTNIELGLKYNSNDNKLNATATLFYSTREDMQIKQWLIDNSEAPEFVGYLSNAPTGLNSGVETSVSYQLTEKVNVFAGLSLLETEVDNIDRLETDPVTWEDVRVSIDGREQAHAPKYQFNLGADWQITNSIAANISLNGKDEFYYSYSHDETSDAVVLANASITYKGDMFDVTLWGRNLTDEEYGVRGFYFGNDPRDGWNAKNYEQFGEPRVIGLKLDYVF